MGRERWTSLGAGTDGVVKALALQSGSGSGYFLYAGGQFVNAGGVVVNNIARWNGFNWAALSGGVDATGSFYPDFAGVNAIFLDSIFDTTNQVTYFDVYVGGGFVKSIEFSVARNVGKFSEYGPAWFPFGEGIERVGFNPDCTYWFNPYFAYVTDLARIGTNIYVAGFFNSVDRSPDPFYSGPECDPCGCLYSQNLAKIAIPTQTLSRWARIIAGPDAIVLTVRGSDLYVGYGNLLYVEDNLGIVPDYILRYRPSAGWQNLGLGQPGRPVGVGDLANNFYGIYTTNARWILP